MGMQETIRTFANRMFAYRTEMGLSQEELSDLLGLDNSYVSLLERGARVPSLISLHRIAMAFGVKPHDLLTEDDKGRKFSFRKKELTYLIRNAAPEKIDKIYRIVSVLREPVIKKTK